MKKRFYTLLVLSVCAVFLFGCDNPSSSPSSNNNKDSNTGGSNNEDEKSSKPKELVLFDGLLYKNTEDQDVTAIFKVVKENDGSFKFWTNYSKPLRVQLLLFDIENQFEVMPKLPDPRGERDNLISGECVIPSEIVTKIRNDVDDNISLGYFIFSFTPVNHPFLINDQVDSTQFSSKKCKALKEFLKS